jgi:basic amino acid/polyamine antiporter, APA family
MPHPFLTAAPLEVSAAPAIPPSDSLPRRLGFWTALAVVVGDVVGSAIFRVPSEVAGAVPAAGGIMAVWVIGGVITLCGALSLAELSAAMPRAGGVFVFLREAFGPGVAFLYGWTILLAEPAGAAAVALVFAEYLGRIVPLTPIAVRAVAAAIIILIAATGYRSVRGAGAIARLSTAAKIVAVLAVVLAAFLWGDAHAGALGHSAPPAAGPLWGGMGLGLVTVLWAYTGWHDVSLIAGEVRDPGRTLPRALIVGMAIVILVYVALNAAFLYVLPLDVLQRSPQVATETMVRLVGPGGAAIVAVMVMISVLGALNGTTLVNPRVFYAMAREGLLFRPLGRAHPRWHTPHVSVAVFALLALVFVWTRSFEQLIEAFVLGVWPFLALAVAAVIVLRRRNPGLARPYLTPGYPWVPLVFFVGVLVIVISALVQHPVTTLAGIGLTLLGVPFYLLGKRRRPAS